MSEPTNGASEPDAPEPTATVRSYETPAGTWHLVDYNGWQISVGPDGLLMLPRHLRPSEVTDFCNAALAAVDVGNKVVAANAANTTPPPTPEELEATGAPIVTERGARRSRSAEGDVPANAVKMAVTARAPIDRSAIGRPRRRDPRQPRTHQTPQSPIPGVQNARKA